MFGNSVGAPVTRNRRGSAPWRDSSVTVAPRAMRCSATSTPVSPEPITKTLAGRRAPSAASAPGAHGSSTTWPSVPRASTGAKARSNESGMPPSGRPAASTTASADNERPSLQRHARGCARHQTDNLGSLDPHLGGRELFLQVAPVGKTWREILHRRDSSFVEPAAEVIGIVRPYRHALRGNIQQERRVVGAIRRTGTGTTRRVDQRDLRFGFAPAQMYRGEHAGSTATHDRDAHHDGRLYLAGGLRCLIAAAGGVAGGTPPAQSPSCVARRHRRHDVHGALFYPPGAEYSLGRLSAAGWKVDIAPRRPPCRTKPTDPDASDI